MDSIWHVDPFEFLTAETALYIALGFVAQLIDGALGQAYGVIVTVTLLAAGSPPAIASASTHATEIVTTGLAGGSHVWHRNVDWGLFKRLAPGGVVGGFVGAYVLTKVPEDPIKLLISIYLLVMAVLIGRHVYTGGRTRDHNMRTVPIGLAGGFFDAVGGGGWGAFVNSTLITRGESARHSIGSASLAEFFVTVAVSATFVSQLNLGRYASVVVSLIIGGAIAAPLAGWISKTLPHRVLAAMVCLVVGCLALYTLISVGSDFIEAL
ncbi:MAG TPA: sulfite exporter TauE/SafE family protein [Sinorhizobium sp.]|nr:sulfite exporter TauE/SafE family protein [Sinorhizobium sp.]